MNPDGSKSSRVVDRRRLLAKSLALGLAASVSLGVTERAQASRRWCSVDPVVLIDGRLADIFLASDVKLQLSATGPSILRISLPESSQGSVILSDTGFGLKGYDIEFVTDSSLKRTAEHTPIRIAALTPSSDSTLPLKVTFAPRTLDSSRSQVLFGTSAEGLVNRWVKLRV